MVYQNIWYRRLYFYLYLLPASEEGANYYSGHDTEKKNDTEKVVTPVCMSLETSHVFTTLNNEKK